MTTFHPIEIFSVDAKKFRSALDAGPMGFDYLSIDERYLPKEGKIFFLISNNCFNSKGDDSNYQFPWPSIDDFQDFLNSESKRCSAIELLKEPYEVEDEPGCKIMGIDPNDGSQFGLWSHNLQEKDPFYLLDTIIRLVGEKVETFDCPE